MKKLIWILTVVLTFALCGFAQNAPAKDTKAKAKPAATETKDTKAKPAATEAKAKPAAAKTSTVQGCLEKTGDTYTIKNRNYPDGATVTSKEDISKHVGHTVKLTGTWSADKKTFEATKLTHIAAECKAAAAKKPAAATEKKTDTKPTTKKTAEKTPTKG